MTHKMEPAAGERRASASKSESKRAENTLILPFPQRGPFIVHIEREEAIWLVVCRDHGWIYANFPEAITEAYAVARGFGVAVLVAP